MSRYLVLYNHQLSKGIQIPYPSISLHAIQTITAPGDASPSKALYLQISLSALIDDNPGAADEGAYTEDDVLELSIIPSKPATEPTFAAHDQIEPQERITPVEQFFEALSACSNLNPDSANSSDAGQQILTEDEYFVDDETEGTGVDGLPPAFPGSGGWITADNVNQFFDADGNWVGRAGAGTTGGAGATDGVSSSVERLGDITGRRREREDNEADGDKAGEATDETKWRRTE
jgi:nucleotide-sensitive chloride channel 1A